MNTLQFRFEPENEWHGLLVANVASGAFKAEAGAWFNTLDVERFANALAAYPLKPDDLPMISGGIWTSAGELATPHLAVSVAPYDAHGRIRITVHLSSEGDRPDEDLGNAATVRFLATYADLAALAADMSAMLKGQIASAELISSAS